MSKNSEALAGLDNEINRLKARVAHLEHLHTLIPWDTEDEKSSTVLNIISQATGVFGDSKATWTWLCTPQFRFEGRSPLDVAISGEDERVMQLISAIQYGVYL